MSFSIEVTLDSVDAEASAAFWCAATGAEIEYRRPPYVALRSPDGMMLLVQQVDAMSDGSHQRVHFDLRVDDPAADVERLVGLGASVVRRVDESATGGSAWTVMRAPDGNVFCVCPPR